MEWGWICVAVAAVAIVGWIVIRSAVYRRLIADGHFLEVAQQAVARKSR